MRVLVLLALVGAALAAPKHVTKIVGGEATAIEQYPYMSNMLYTLWGGLLLRQYCGGSLITTTSVLSAAHCYVGDRPSDWTVRLGSRVGWRDGQLIPASQLVLHAEYNLNTFENDIAIVKLTSAAVLSASVAVARIPGPDYILPDGTKVVSIGYGALQPGESSHDELEHVSIDTINQELCAERYAFLNTQPGFPGWPDVTDVMLCAGILDVGGKNACQGDYGGPLAHDLDVIIGIASWGFSCAHEFYPGVNTRVSSFTDWIVANT